MSNLQPDPLLTSEGVMAFLAAPLELAEKFTTFLTTHPTPVGIVNSINAVFGYGQNIPAFGEGVILKLRRVIGETVEDLLYMQ